MGKRFSHSRLRTFRTCPQQYKFQYISKVEVPKRVTADIWLGTTVHSVLHILYERGNDGVVIPLDTVLERFRKEWEGDATRFVEVRGEYLGVDDYIRNGEKMLSDHYAAYQPFRPGTLLGAEATITFPIPNSDNTIMARVDRYWKRDDGVIEICDYKTGKRLPSVDDPDFVSQMGIYQMAIRSRHPQFETIEVAQYMLKHNEVVRTRLSDDTIDMLVENIRNDISAIQTAERVDNFPAVEGGYCSYCQYAELCPAKRHRSLMEEATVADSNGKSDAELAVQLADRYIDVDQKIKELEKQKDGMKLDVAEIAGRLNATRLDGKSGYLSLKSQNGEKFVTKTESAEASAELNHLARQMGFEDYFTLDATQFLKEIYQRGRLTPEQKVQLEKYVRLKMGLTIYARPGKVVSEDDE
ncbi:MAG: PD-(D/E)XK nuclease family protein [Candidatus Zixiibacteriota bacterium]